jgi:predicted nucleic acid-binding protein
MAYKVVLDANALYPFSLRDLLLRLAEQELFVHVWSDRIIDEMTANLIDNQRVTEAQAVSLAEQMRTAFPEAAQDLKAILAIEDAMENDPGDRHVLATAVIAGAEAIITFNTRHFPEEALAPWSKGAITPDEFLCNLHDMFGPTVEKTVVNMAAELKKPPRTTEDAVGLLQLGGLRQFVERMCEPLGLKSRTDAEIIAAREARRPTQGSPPD